MFDVAKSLLVVDAAGYTEIGRHEEELLEADPVARAKKVADLGVEVLICGAVSRMLELLLVSEGVRVFPHTSGLAEEVLTAFLSGRFTARSFLMPGCCGRGRRGQGGRGSRRSGGGME